MIKKVFFILITAFLFSGCHEYYFDSGYPCDFCYTGIQSEGQLTIQLTVNDENPKVPIVILKNKMEQHDTIWVDTTSEMNYEIFVPIDTLYTVVATYIVNNKKVQAVDADKITTRKNTTDCDEECWIVFDAKVDVSLKYDL